MDLRCLSSRSFDHSGANSETSRVPATLQWRMAGERFHHSVGRRLTFEDNEYIVEELTSESFAGIDIAIFSAGGSFIGGFGPIAALRCSLIVNLCWLLSHWEMIKMVVDQSSLLQRKSWICNFFLAKWGVTSGVLSDDVLQGGDDVKQVNGYVAVKSEED